MKLKEITTPFKTGKKGNKTKRVLVLERANYISEKFKTVFYKVTCWKAVPLLGYSKKWITMYVPATRNFMSMSRKIFFISVQCCLHNRVQFLKFSEILENVD